MGGDKVVDVIFNFLGDWETVRESGLLEDPL